MQPVKFCALARLLNRQLQYSVISGMLGKVGGGVSKAMTLEVKESFLQEVACNMRPTGLREVEWSV